MLQNRFSAYRVADCRTVNISRKIRKIVTWLNRYLRIEVDEAQENSEQTEI
jgi:hypothetical protein